MRRGARSRGTRTRVARERTSRGAGPSRPGPHRPRTTHPCTCRDLRDDGTKYWPLVAPAGAAAPFCTTWCLTEGPHCVAEPAADCKAGANDVLSSTEQISIASMCQRAQPREKSLALRFRMGRKRRHVYHESRPSLVRELGQRGLARHVPHGLWPTCGTQGWPTRETESSASLPRLLLVRPLTGQADSPSEHAPERTGLEG